jgi:hypothetical protein
MADDLCNRIWADWVWASCAGQQSNYIDPKAFLTPNKNAQTCVIYHYVTI